MRASNYITTNISRLKPMAAFSLFVLWAIVSLSACSGTDKPFHPEYFDPIFDQLDKNDQKYQPGAMDSLESAYKKFGRPGVGDLSRKYVLYIDYHLNTDRDYITALRYADSIINILSGHLSDPQVAKAHAQAFVRKGNLLRQLGKYDDAIFNLNTGKQLLTEKFPDEPCELFAYNEGLANLYYQQGHYLDAIPFFRALENMAGTCRKDFLQFVYTQGNLNNIGLCYQILERWDSCQYYFRQALDYIERNGYRFPNDQRFVLQAKLITYNNICGAALGEKEIPVATRFALMGLDTANFYKDLKLNPVDFFIQLGAINIEARNWKAAEQHLTEASRYIDPKLYTHNIVEYYQLRYSCQLGKGDSSRALREITQANIVRDSLERRDKQFRQLDLKKEFAYRETQYNSIALAKSNALKQVYLWIAILVLLASMLVAALIWNGLRRKAKHVATLSEVNALLSRKNAELQQTLHSLEITQKENEKLIRVVAHDLKNPISAIRNLIYSAGKSIDHSGREALQLAGNTCSSCLTLINNLLSENRKMQEIEKEIVDMSVLVKSAVALLQAKADEKDQQLLVSTEQALIRVNRQDIWRVVSNLINNSIKFSTAGSKIEISLENKDGAVLLKIRDTGIGIPAEFHDKLFSLPREVSRPGTEGEESHGMGLLIAKQIIEDHNGRLWFESNVGKGSVFFIELPQLN